MASRAENIADPVVRFVRTLLSTGLFILLVTVARAQHYPILQVPNSPHGIFTMMQDHQSGLWLGTIDDVVRFDGEHFYSLRQYGFPRETPNSFAEDSDGGIWIATQGTAAGGGSRHGGIYRYRSGKIDKVFSGDGLSLVSLSAGGVLASVGTESSGKPTYGDLILFQKTKDGWTATKLLDKQANHLTVDHQGNVLYPCPGGWCEIVRVNLMKTLGSSGSLDVRRNAGSPLIERVLRDRFGCVWFRAEAFSSYQCPGDAQPQVIPTNISEYDSSAHLEEASDGSIFMLVRMALGRPNKFNLANSEDGLPNDMGTALVALDGTIWIGAESGLYKFPHPFQLREWDKTDGVRSPASIIRNGQDILVSEEGIRKLDRDGRRWAPVGGSEGIGANLAIGPHSTLILSSRSALSQMDLNGTVLARGSIPDGDIEFKLTSAPDGSVWLAHRGVSRVIPTGNKLVLRHEMVSDRGTQDIQYDPGRQILWACDGKDVVFQKDGKWSRISQSDGLLNLPCETIGIQADGNLWLGYKAAAFAWIGNPSSGKPTVRNYTGALNDVVPDNSVHSIYVDHRGWIWRDSDTLYLATSEAAKSDRWLRLSEEDGLSFQAPLGGRPFVSDPDGSVWLGTSVGVAHFSPPADFATRFPKPSIFIAGYSVGPGPPTLADAVGKLPRNSDVILHAGSLQFDRRGSLRIRYRLLPDSPNWIDTHSLNLNLGKLGWGDHRIELQAQVATGPWSDIAEDSITVSRPVLLSWPALAGFALALGLFIAGGRRWRKKRDDRAKRAFPDLGEWRLAALSPELHQLDGTLLDSRFEVGRILARGGFATVTEGSDLLQDGRRCAIKIFRQELVDKEWMARRFQQEVLALEQVHHRNVVNIYGSGTTSRGSFYLVMEFIEGQTLRELLEIGKLTPHRSARYLRQAGNALDQIHQHGICHRDLKPENLMIRCSSSVEDDLVLIDFSIALVKDPDETLYGLSRAAGTLYYMAPEQAIGYADPSTDIYSLAKILIEMLTGQRLSILLPDASMDLPDRVFELLGELPVKLTHSSRKLISSALEFDPARRPKQAGEFADQLASDLESN